MGEHQEQQGAEDKPKIFHGTAAAILEHARRSCLSGQRRTDYLEVTRRRWMEIVGVVEESVVRALAALHREKLIVWDRLVYDPDGPRAATEIPERVTLLWENIARYDALVAEETEQARCELDCLWEHRRPGRRSA